MIEWHKAKYFYCYCKVIETHIDIMIAVAPRSELSEGS